jgi:hypothetical protein
MKDERNLIIISDLHLSEGRRYQEAKQKLRKPLGEDDWKAVYRQTVRTV